MKKNYNSPAVELFSLEQDEAIAAGGLMDSTSAGDGYVFDFGDM